jgi:hypothetical protein
VSLDRSLLACPSSSRLGYVLFSPGALGHAGEGGLCWDGHPGHPAELLHWAEETALLTLQLNDLA